MRDFHKGSMIAFAVALAAAGGLAIAGHGNAAQSGDINTPWGEPDLQGIWTVETATPLERPERFANQEFFTEAQRAELDRERAGLSGRDKRGNRGSELDVSGAYNAEFSSIRRTGTRTSMIIDPPDGKIPPITEEARQRAREDRAFRLALLQSTATCKEKLPACAGGTFDPKPSPRRAERVARYNTARMNRHNDVEDGEIGRAHV